ncbi:BTB/POZ domain-containing protein 6 isoform X5 [Crotalus tigris]|uniref:BTB/POZ domain-containing protein 6 isoform X5 n=1 Tax=Crotalus tigris TaxID=88082 RepID=UPI00192F919A|nr:BTB/POZ domain-containing protein 6 isoform X5 [Crotalus tigris]
MPLDHDCFYGRIMKCLTFFLLLPETLKKSKKSVRANSKGAPCYEILPLGLKKKMAAELYPASANTNLANSNNAAAANTKKNALQFQQSAQPPPPPPLQNLNNNNVESANWQSFHPTLRERNALMFNSELMADVHFIVGPVGAAKKVPAHKYVLAVGSSVFYAMFYGDLAEVKSEIHIPDVEPAAFLILLKDPGSRLSL